MKTRLFLAAIMTMGFLAFTYGQERSTNEMQTLFGNTDNKIDHGGYGGISVGYTQINGEDVMTLGGRLAWVIDHHVAVGLAGRAFMNSVFIDGIPNTPENGLYLSGGYGGFFVEPILFPNFPVHVSFPILIGGGGLVLNDHTWHDYDWDNDYYEPYDWDSYFVFEPGMEIELNVVKYFRVAFGGSYRLTNGLHISELPEDMMNGFNGNVTLKFGWF
jgi:hypothetical protein